MNIYTEMIVKVLNCNVEVAVKVQEKMVLHGINFSECSWRTFKKAAKHCFTLI